MRKHSKYLSILLTISIVFSFLALQSNVALAATDTYRAVVKGKDYGEYNLYENGSDCISYIKSNMISKNGKFSFYYLDYSKSANNDLFKSFFSSAMVHDGTPNGGDYIAKSYSNYSFSYYKFTNLYFKNGTPVNLFLISFNIEFFDSPTEETAINSEINTIINSLKVSGKSDYEKVFAIYSWITSHVSYDYSNAGSVIYDYHAFTPYNALFKGSAVCQGVSTLFYRMLLNVGIDNRITNNNTHCWNIVKIDGVYYYCDPTWDLGSNENTFNYFLCGTNSSFEKDHSITDSSINLGYSISANNYLIPSSTVSNSASTSSTTNTTSTTSSTGNSAGNLVNGFVERLYTKAMGRDADQNGLTYWANELANKRIDGATVAKSFINSTEFKNRNLDNISYLSVLYSVFFNRDMDDAGRDFWLSQLSYGMSRESVLECFVGSSEWKSVCTSYGIESGSSSPVSLISKPVNVEVEPNADIYAFAERLYSCALNRESDPEGKKYWAYELANKRISGTNAAYKFIFSSEFINSNVSDEEYINRLYRVFMGREADSAGFDFWMSCFGNGYSRKDIFDCFSASAEFSQICSSYGINV